MQPGAGLTLDDLLIGQAISAQAADEWRHPWWTTPAWIPTQKRWVATVKPGFVNSQAPVFRATVEEQQKLANPWAENPLTGKKYFSASVFGQQTIVVKRTVVELPLYLDPAMPLTFRGLGFDGDPQYPVPQFFKERGVADAPPLPSAQEIAAGVSYKPPEKPEGLRLLRACDLWIHQPRVALTSSVLLDPSGYLTGKATFTQTLGLRSAAPSDSLRVIAGTLVRSVATIDPLSGDYTEANYDEMLISTVFLLSPPDANLGSEPDGTWEPYVRHNLFWNLQYLQPRFRLTIDEPELVALPVLAGGVASLVINSYLASLDNAYNWASNILKAHSMAGKWWTATGGGSDANVPSEPLSVPKTGLDKRARLIAEATAKAQQQRAETLDPSFPYRAEPFDFSLLDTPA